MRHLVVLALTCALFAAAVPATAQSGPFLTVVNQDDRHLTLQLSQAQADLGYLDLDGNNVPGAMDPHEPIYLVFGSSFELHWADVRMTQAGAYAAGTTVDTSNWDMTRGVTNIQGWFAKTSSDVWYIDVDANRQVSYGDVRLTGSVPGERVLSGDPAVGTPLEQVQQSISRLERLGYLDLNENNKRDPTEPIFLDVDKDGRVSRSDVRLSPKGPAVEPPSPSGGDGTDSGPELATDAEVQELRDKLNGLEDRLDALSERVETLEQTRGTTDAGAGPTTDSPVGLLLALTALAGAAAIAYRAGRRQ